MIIISDSHFNLFQQPASKILQVKYSSHKKKKKKLYNLLHRDGHGSGAADGCERQRPPPDAAPVASGCERDVGSRPPRRLHAPGNHDRRSRYGQLFLLSCKFYLIGSVAKCVFFSFLIAIVVSLFY